MDAYEIVTDPAKIDLDILHAALLRLYGCHAIPRHLLHAALSHSLVFAAYSANGDLAAFARVITDEASYAHITDACVLESHRGRGLSQRIMQAVLVHPSLASVQTFSVSSPTNGFFAHCGYPVTNAAEPTGVLHRPV